MKNLLLLLICFLLALVYSAGQLDTKDRAVKQDGNLYAELASNAPVEIVYDDDMMTLMQTYSLQNQDDMMPCRLNHVSRQLRLLTSRLQLRLQVVTWLVKRITLLLSNHLSALVNHISLSYSSIRQLCWQYAADCYVFAFRQIII